MLWSAIQSKRPNVRNRSRKLGNRSYRRTGKAEKPADRRRGVARPAKMTGDVGCMPSEAGRRLGQDEENMPKWIACIRTKGLRKISGIEEMPWHIRAKNSSSKESPLQRHGRIAQKNCHDKVWTRSSLTGQNRDTRRQAGWSPLTHAL